MSDEPSRPHSEKPEPPVKKAEDQGAECHRADGLGTRKVTYHRGVHRANKWDGDVGHDQRAGERPDGPM